jgi:hypothetical protein
MAIAEMFAFRYRVSPQPSSAAPPVGEQACSAVSLPLAGIRKQHLLLAFDALRCGCPRWTCPQQGNHGHKRAVWMAEPEVKRRGAPSSDASARHKSATRSIAITDEPKRQAAFRWLGVEAEARRLREEQTHHYVRWTFFAAVAAVIVGLIGVGLALLH